MIQKHHHPMEKKFWGHFLRNYFLEVKLGNVLNFFPSVNLRKFGNFLKKNQILFITLHFTFFTSRPFLSFSLSLSLSLSLFFFFPGRGWSRY